MNLIILLIILNFIHDECNSVSNNKTIDERVKLLETDLFNFTSIISNKFDYMEKMINKLMHQRFPRDNNFHGDKSNETQSHDSNQISNVDVTIPGSKCNDWTAYRDIKCIKIIESNGLENFDDAINTCQQHSNDSNLITITSLDEQRFLTNFIFNTNQIVDNVWIGAKYFDSQYQWINGLNLTFTNWAEGYPKNLSYNCVQMHSDPGSAGKWVDESCRRKNLVVCQKHQIWSMDHLQEILINLQETVTNLKQSEASLTNLNILKQSLIPIGFIYVQLANEKNPKEIWPTMTWNDITSSYAGLFFRAFGGNSSRFGSTQEENAPILSKIETKNVYPKSSKDWTSNIQNGQWSNGVYTGGDSGNKVELKLFVTDGEVRPRNTAIRIWKRYG